MTREGSMPGIKIIAVLLIVLGIIALAYEGITYTTREKVLEVGPITATKEKKETIPLSPVVGVLALVGGVALLVFGGRGRP
jgi:drug/metabolite transporter (DMT)-like permease